MFNFKKLFFVFLSLLSSTAYAQDDHELQQLLSPFADIKHLKLTYQEKRFSLFFKQPRLYHGYIEYISPDTFIKQVQSPSRKKIIIVEDQLTLYSYNSNSTSELEQPSKKVVSLDDYPQFKQLKALFSALFKGQATELTQYYRYEINSLADEKTLLRLKPLISDPFTQDNLQKSNINKQIKIIFHDKHITKITMTGLGGERSELLFKEVFGQELFGKKKNK